MRKAMAFLRRDFLIATSYKLDFATKIGSLLLVVPVCYFIGEGVDLRDPAAGSSGGSYFAFLLVGLGLLGFLGISLRAFSQIIRESQMMGTLEIVLLSPTSVAQLLFYSSLWLYLFLTIRFVLFLALGALLGLDLGKADLIAFVIILAMSIPAFAAFGILSATLVVLFKRGGNITAPISAASFILGGVLFPVSKLPEWLQPVSQLLPITYSAEGMRLALFQGASVFDLAGHLGMLSLFIVLLLPASLYLFALAIRRNKVTGSLATY